MNKLKTSFLIGFAASAALSGCADENRAEGHFSTVRDVAHSISAGGKVSIEETKDVEDSFNTFCDSIKKPCKIHKETVINQYSITSPDNTQKVESIFFRKDKTSVDPSKDTIDFSHNTTHPPYAGHNHPFS